MSNFDDLAMAVASFGGNNAVKFDDLGMPSIMVGIPKMKYSDIITGGTQETLPWWIVDGVEKEVIWVSKYINVVVNDRAYSLPMKDPKAYIDFDTALAVCRRKGEGWHLNQNGSDFGCQSKPFGWYENGSSHPVETQTGTEAMKRDMKRVSTHTLTVHTAAAEPQLVLVR